MDSTTISLYSQTDGIRVCHKVSPLQFLGTDYTDYTDSYLNPIRKFSYISTINPCNPCNPCLIYILRNLWHTLLEDNTSNTNLPQSHGSPCLSVKVRTLRHTLFLFSSKRQHITYLLEISNPNSFPKRYYQTLSWTFWICFHSSKSYIADVGDFW